jgi:putative oxidoreductase
MHVIDKAERRLKGRTKLSRAEEVALWAGQGLLASMFLKAGAAKLAKPIPELEEKLGFPKVIGGRMTRFIGASEVAGGIGALLPAATRIAPWLTPVAAGALGAVMLLASGYHLGRREFGYLKTPVMLGALAALVALGRGAHKPIPAR